MKKGILRITNHGVMFWCKGCDMFHVINLDSTYSSITWDFNENYEKPTFSPSILVEYPWGMERRKVICHSFITDGKIQYLGDCTHALANQTIDLEDNDEYK